MFLLSKPPNERIQRFIASQCELPFSFQSSDAHPTEAPRGYTVDHNRIELGEGDELFARGVAAIERWEMFNIGWLELLWPEAPIEKGTTVAVLVHHFGFWSLNACRIVRVVDENQPIRRYGFVYGTLPGHAELGQEQFTVEWHRDSKKVFYDIFAYSRPNNLMVRLAYRWTRALQKRFARDSMQAMLRAVHR